MSDTDDVTELDPDDGWFRTMFEGIPQRECIEHYWLEDKMIRIADCPRCIVCGGRRVWIGWRFWGGWRPCMICGGHGRMPFITPT